MILVGRCCPTITTINSQELGTWKMRKIFFIFLQLVLFGSPPVYSRAVLQVTKSSFPLQSLTHFMTHCYDHFQDNGYSELLVGISPDVPESPEMLEELKQLLTKASASLYRATRLKVCRIYKVFNFSHWLTYHWTMCINWKEYLLNDTCSILAPLVSKPA